MQVLHAAAEADQRFHLVRLGQESEAAERLKRRFLPRPLVDFNTSADRCERAKLASLRRGMNQQVVVDGVRPPLHRRFLPARFQPQVTVAKRVSKFAAEVPVPVLADHDPGRNLRRGARLRRARGIRGTGVPIRPEPNHAAQLPRLRHAGGRINQCQSE